MFGQRDERLQAMGLGGSWVAQRWESAFELLDGRLMLADLNDIQHGDGLARPRGVPKAAASHRTGLM
ncbi:MAG TPA: hypothetical protein VJN19_08850 [Propionibacteriaceae bacterium]|nr:hypothetical protein [Propionibacteriaceae bacterium]